MNTKGFKISISKPCTYMYDIFVLAFIETQTTAFYYNHDNFVISERHA